MDLFFKQILTFISKEVAIICSEMALFLPKGVNFPQKGDFLEKKKSGKNPPAGGKFGINFQNSEGGLPPPVLVLYIFIAVKIARNSKFLNGKRTFLAIFNCI